MNTQELLNIARAYKQTADRAEEIARLAEKRELQHRWEDIVIDIKQRLNVPAEIIPYANCDTLDKSPIIVQVKLDGFSIFASIVYVNGGTIFNSWLSGALDENGNVTSMTPQDNVYMAVLASAEAAGIE